MRTRRTERRRTRRLLPTLLGLLLLAGGLYLLFGGSREEIRTQAKAIADALPKIGKSTSNEEEEPPLSLLEYAATEPQVAHWSLLLQGRHYEQSGQLEQAAATYALVPNDSAASLDAKLALLRIAPAPTGQTEQSAEFGRFLNELEVQLRRARRYDLLPQLQLVRAKAAEEQKDYALAAALYRQVRKEHSGQEAAQRARDALRALEEMPGVIPPRSMAELLDEAELLLLEKREQEALAMVQSAKEQTADHTPAYFEVLLREEQILRRTGRRQEADNLLMLISADAPASLAEQAVLRMAKNAWNANEQDRAITLAAKFEQRFPGSSRMDELRYIKARVLEEQHRLADARETYDTLIEKSREPLVRIKAARQSAWIHLRENEFQSAAKLFEQAGGFAKALLGKLAESREFSSGRPEGGRLSGHRLLREVREEYMHSLFWLAYSLEKLTPELKRSLKSADKSTQVLVQEISATDPYGYYRYLSEALLNVELPFSIKAPGTEERTSCTSSTPADLLSRIKQLDEAGLRDFTRFEIDWYFSRTPSNADAAARFRDDLSRALLYSAHSHINRSIGFVDELLRSGSGGRPEEALRVCAPLLFELSFPTPFIDAFQEAARSTDLPLERLLAIARTESHFDPLAVSPKNAAGLLQLLKKTAEEEGLTPEQNIFDPVVNIRLGAKHLKRLLDRHKGSAHHAIAAYNAGSTAVERWRSRHPDLPPEAWTELISYPETKNYVKEVLRSAYFYEKRLELMPQPHTPE